MKKYVWFQVLCLSHSVALTDIDNWSLPTPSTPEPYVVPYDNEHSFSQIFHNTVFGKKNAIQSETPHNKF
jgi:hypothetical protein